MKHNSVQMYKRNKNVFFDGVEDRFIYKFTKRFLQYIIRCDIKPVFSERIIEYPLLFQHLKVDAHNILDFGCVEDLLPIHLCSLGYVVTGLDFRAYSFTHENFRFIQADILSWDAPKEAFDAVISISTIEHVGLGGYGDPMDQNGDHVAVEKLWRSLKRSGDLIVTLPAGKKSIERGMRIYDMESVSRLIPGAKRIRAFCKENRYANWKETTEKKVSSLVYDDYYADSPAQGVWFIVAIKA